MKICIQLLHSSFQDAPNGVVHTSPRHVNVLEISSPSGSSVPCAAETASDLTPSGCVIPLALVNKPTVSGPVRKWDTSHLHCSLKINFYVFVKSVKSRKVLYSRVHIFSNCILCYFEYLVGFNVHSFQIKP